MCDAFSGRVVQRVEGQERAGGLGAVHCVAHAPVRGGAPSKRVFFRRLAQGFEKTKNENENENEKSKDKEKNGLSEASHTKQHAMAEPAARKAARPAITKPSRFIAAAKAGEDNLIEEYLDDKKKNIDVNKVCSSRHKSKHKKEFKKFFFFA